MLKHNVEVDMDKLEHLPIRPPRRRLWDLVPTRIAVWLVERGFNPKPTPFEKWALRSAMLRAIYTWQRTALATARTVLTEDRDIPPEELN